MTKNNANGPTTAVTLAAVLAAVGVLVLVGVSARPPKGAEAAQEAFERRGREGGARWRELGAEAGPGYEAALAKADDASLGESSFREATRAYVELIRRTDSESARRVEGKVAEQLAEAGSGLVLDKAARGEETAGLEKPLRQVAGKLDDPAARHMVDAVADLAAANDRHDVPAARQAAGEALQAAAAAAQAAPPNLPPGDPELANLARRAAELRDRIREAANRGQQAAALVREFVQVTDLANSRAGKLMLQGADWATKVAGPALQVAGALGDVANLAGRWNDLDLLGKIGAAAGTMASVLKAAAPLLGIASAKILPVVAALAVIAKLADLGQILNLKLPGPNLFGGGGDKKDDKGGDGKPGDKPADKPGDGKPGNKPADKPGNGDAGRKPPRPHGDAATKAAVAGAYVAAHGDPKAMARDMGRRLGVDPQKFEKGFEQAIRDNPEPGGRFEALQEATRSVPGAKDALAARDRQARDRAAAHRHELSEKPGATPDDLRRRAAELAAGGKPDLAALVSAELAHFPANDAAALLTQAYLLAWMHDAGTMPPPPPGKEN